MTTFMDDASKVGAVPEPLMFIQVIVGQVTVYVTGLIIKTTDCPSASDSVKVVFAPRVLV
jgi:hypothetical protein